MVIWRWLSWVFASSRGALMTFQLPDMFHDTEAIVDGNHWMAFILEALMQFETVSSFWDIYPRKKRFKVLIVQLIVLLRLRRDLSNWVSNQFKTPSSNGCGLMRL